MALVSWQTISGTQTDADSPINQVLMDSLRIDLDHLRQVLYGITGGGFLTPIEGHDHDGANSKIVPTVADNGITTAKILDANVTTAKLADGAVAQIKLEDYTSGGYFLKRTTGSGSTASTISTVVPVMTMRSARAGTLTVKFDLKINNVAGIAYGQIYRNGVAVGIIQNTSLTTYVTFSENIPGWSPNDTIELWTWVSNVAYTGSSQNLTLYTGQVFREYTENPGFEE